MPPSNVASAQRICNLVPSRNVDADWTFAHALGSGSLAAPTRLPPQVDLRSDWWDVGDQGDTGSCVGWASTDGVMRYHLVQAGRLRQDEHLSVRATWMASKEFDEFAERAQTFIEAAGTSLKAALDICRKYGVVPDQLLPFEVQQTLYTGEEETFYATMAQRRAASYFNLRLRLHDWRSWLAVHGPLLVGLHVDATWDGATSTDGLLDTFRPDTVRGGHAVCVVGYRADGRFILRNSWGTAWGDRGFAYASEAYVRAAFFDESYGITV